MSVFSKKQLFLKRKLEKRFEPQMSKGWLTPDDEELKNKCKMQTKSWMRQHNNDRYKSNTTNY